MNLAQLREGMTSIWHQQSQTGVHDWRGFLRLTLRQNSGRKPKRVFQWQKNVTGRQLARVSAIKYRETIWSDSFAGNRLTVQCLQPAVLATESLLELAEAQRKRVVRRMGGDAGSDEQLR